MLDNFQFSLKIVLNQFVLWANKTVFFKYQEQTTSKQDFERSKTWTGNRLKLVGLSNPNRIRNL